MVNLNTARKIALSFDEAVELPHFDLTSFRIRKKIFATMDEKKKRMCLMLKPEDQSVFCTFDNSIIYPVPNKWGLKGATYIELKKIKKEMLTDALIVAYCTIAPKNLAEKYKSPDL
jgi:hypothetical protein